MKRPVIFLTILLVCQIVLAMGFYFTSYQQTASAREKLLTVNSSEVDEIVIDASGSEPLDVQKTEDGWHLPKYANAVADAGKVKRLLGQLGGMERPWPVASSADAAERFHVDEQAYERRLELRKDGQPLATLFMGDSAGLHRTYLRISGDKEVFEAPLGSYELSVKPQDWIDHNLLNFDAGDVTAVTLPDCRLKRQGDTFQFTPLQAGEQPNDEEVRQLLDTLSGISVRDVYVGSHVAPAEFEIELSLQNGKTRNYELVKGEKDDYVLLRVSGYSTLFKVRPELLSDLKQYTLQTLVKTAAVNHQSDKAAATQTDKGHG